MEPIDIKINKPWSALIGNRSFVVGLVTQDDKSWLLETKDFYPKGYQRLLGGGIEKDEKPDDAIEREVFEETSFKINNKKLISTLCFKFLDKEGNIYNATFYIYYCHVTKGEPKLNDGNEHIKSFKFVPPALIDQLADKWYDVDKNLEFYDWNTKNQVKWSDYGHLWGIIHKEAYISVNRFQKLGRKIL